MPITVPWSAGAAAGLLAAVVTLGAGAAVSDAAPVKRNASAPVAAKFTVPSADALVSSKLIPVRLQVGHGDYPRSGAARYVILSV